MANMAVSMRRVISKLHCQLSRFRATGYIHKQTVHAEAQNGSTNNSDDENHTHFGFQTVGENEKAEKGMVV